jgi:trans-2,3-dihydro-3-hydroxyanthranilate isomerase
MSKLAYEIVDVFTDRPFTGNPLAVVSGADGLSTGQLQALAREFHLSETTFVLPASADATASGATYRVRIFTPETELPFAGHPSVGTAVTLARQGAFPLSDSGVTEVVQECGAGLLSIQVYGDGRATLAGAAPTLGPELDPALLLQVVGLTAADLAGPPPRTAGRHGIGDVIVFAWDAARSVSHARAFVPGSGVPEDPATGSAALGLGVYAVACGLLPGEGRSSYVIHQGAELHRPSTLDCTVTAEAGAAVAATVTGTVVPIATGEIAVPPFVG